MKGRGYFEMKHKRLLVKRNVHETTKLDEVRYVQKQIDCMSMAVKAETLQWAELFLRDAFLRLKFSFPMQYFKKVR